MKKQDIELLRTARELEESAEDSENKKRIRLLQHYAFLRNAAKLGTGVGNSRAIILLHIELFGPSKMTDLAEACHVSTAAATGTVESMVKEGLLTRTFPSEDRRKIVPKLKKAGKDRLEELLKLPEEE